MMDKKQDALDQIVDLAVRHDITAEEIAARLIDAAPRNPAGQKNILNRLFAYVGGIFILAGLAAYVGLVWDDLNSYARVVITFGTGLVALVLGLVALRDARYVRAATPLFLIAALLEPTGMFVFLAEFFERDDPELAAIVVFAPLAAQMLLLFWSQKRASLLFFSLVYSFAFFSAVMSKLDIDGDLVAATLGLSGLLISHAINRTAYRAFVPFTYFFFALCFACGMFALLEDSYPLDFLLVGVAAFMIYASVIAQSRSLLVASVLVMLGYLGYFTSEYFADMVSWPIALIVMGFVMLGISSYAVKLGQRIRQA